MLDPPSVNEHDEEYFYDLVLVAPDEDEVLKTMMEGLWYQLKFMDNLAKRKENNIENNMALRLKYLKAAAMTTKQSAKL